MKNVSKDILYIGVNDRDIDLFEGQYHVPNGMAYNSYVILDDKVAVMDTVDARFVHQWLDNLDKALNGRKVDYLVVQHMEPDHSAGIQAFMRAYPDARVVANDKAFRMIGNFFPRMDMGDRQLPVKDGDTLSLGKHRFTFVAAPMVHWPEVMLTYENTEKVLFSADAFGKFGALDHQEDWADEARRYYIGIVGKYGAQVQSLLKKAAALDIAAICPLHGPVLSDNLSYYMGLYDTWSSYSVETEGVVVAYTSVYGNTKAAVEKLVEKLRDKGCPKVIVHELARCDIHQAVADAFRYPKMVLATTTYNADIFPDMKNFIHHLLSRNYQKRTVGFIENGSWAPMAAKVMKDMLKDSKDITFTENNVKILSALSAENGQQLESMAAELCKDYIERSEDKANKNDLTALFKIGYGLYVVTSHDGKRDNGLIVNTVTQVTNTPNRVAVTINKDNYSHHVIRNTGKMNVNCLSVEAPFKVFEAFGFRSGRHVDKFEGCDVLRSDNGLVILPRYINAMMSLEVEQYVDLGTHGMFICAVTEARVISKKETMTYTYYQENVKPKPETKGKKGYVCKVCGYVYEGEPLPDDFVCPLCKHGAQDFEPIA